MYDIATTNYTLIYEMDNTDSFSRIVGISKGWARNIIRDYNGWYRQRIFITNERLASENVIMMSKQEVVNIVQSLKLQLKVGQQVKVVDVDTDETNIYPSIRACARALLVSQTSIKDNSIIKSKSKLFFVLVMRLN